MTIAWVMHATSAKKRIATVPRCRTSPFTGMPARVGRTNNMMSIMTISDPGRVLTVPGIFSGSYAVERGDGCHIARQ